MNNKIVWLESSYEFEKGDVSEKLNDVSLMKTTMETAEQYMQKYVRVIFYFNFDFRLNDDMNEETVKPKRTMPPLVLPVARETWEDQQLFAQQLDVVRKQQIKHSLHPRYFDEKLTDKKFRRRKKLVVDTSTPFNSACYTM